MQATSGRLPLDIVDEIAKATVFLELASQPLPQSAEYVQLRRLGISPLLSEHAHSILRTLSQVSRDWRQALLPRVWKTVQLQGFDQHHVAAIHKFAGPSIQRLVVPWGALAAPLAWKIADLEDDEDDQYAEDSDSSTCISASSSRSYNSACSVDSNSNLRHSAPDQATTSDLDRLQQLFGNQKWPAVQHLDMSFMPLLSYRGIADHLTHTVPCLRTLRIGGFVPEAVLNEILQSRLCEQLDTLEISASVWTNSGLGRRGEPGTACSEINHSMSLKRLVVSDDALRTPAVFSMAISQTPTLTSLHLLDCDYKIMDMLCSGRLEERHMHAMEWGATQMQLPGNHRHHQQPTPAPVLCWPSLKGLHIERYHMAPREHTGLSVYSKYMPSLEQLVVGSMEPSDSYHPAPNQMDMALHVPRLRGRFHRLVHISAPLIDTQMLSELAPKLRSLRITGHRSGALANATFPSDTDIDMLRKAGLPLTFVDIG